MNRDRLAKNIYMNTPKNLNVVGPQLQILRKWRGWTQRDLSTKLLSMGWKLSRNGLAQMEVTRKRVTDGDLIFLAKALNVSIAEFFPLAVSENVRSRIRSHRLILWQPTPSAQPQEATKPGHDLKQSWRQQY